MLFHVGSLLMPSMWEDRVSRSQRQRWGSGAMRKVIQVEGFFLEQKFNMNTFLFKLFV